MTIPAKKSSRDSSEWPAEEESWSRKLRHVRGRGPRPTFTVSTLALAASALAIACAWLGSSRGAPRGVTIDVGTTTRHEPPAPPREEPRAPLAPAAPSRASLPRTTTPPPTSPVRETSADDGAGAGARTPLALDPTTAPVLVRVLEGHSRQPVRHAWIELRHTRADGTTTNSLVTSDFDGTWEGRLTRGTLVAMAWYQDTVSDVEALDLRAGAAQELELRLEPGYPVAGIVRDATTGAPIAGAKVAFWTHSELDRSTTGPDGRFRHPRFPRPGEAHQVRATARGYGAEVRYLEIGRAGEWNLAPAVADDPPQMGTDAVYVELELVPAATFTGRVLDPTGRPVVGAQVRAEGRLALLPGVETLDRASVRTDEHGAFRLGGLRSDIDHELVAHIAGLAEHRSVLEARWPASGSLDVGDLKLAPSSSLGGWVVDASGHVAEGLRVLLKPREEPAAATPSRAGRGGVATRGRRRVEALSDIAGAFRFEDLRAGRYTLSVRRGRTTLVAAEVELARGEQRLGIELELPAEALSLSGTVSAGGERVAGATLELSRGRERLVVTSDAEGRFHALGLDASSYRLSVRVPNSDSAEALWTLDEVWPGDLQVDLDEPSPARAHDLHAGR